MPIKTAFPGDLVLWRHDSKSPYVLGLVTAVGVGGRVITADVPCAVTGGVQWRPYPVKGNSRILAAGSVIGDPGSIAARAPVFENLDAAREFLAPLRK